ncbi:MAG: curli-like amyloid fiber formation chaperone CsgH [Oricola sp.]
MFKARKSGSVSAAILLMGLAAAGCSAGASETVAAGDAVSCAIDVTARSGAIGLGAIVQASRPVTGSYRFNVTGSGGGGSTNISQGGGFSAGPGDDARLGTLMLGNHGASYDVRLDVNVGGHDYHCVETVGGI